MCTTTTHYATHISTACSRFGNGQCDGYCEDHGLTTCTCDCHTDWDLPITTADVQDWHDVRNNIVKRFTGSQRVAQAQAVRDHLNETGTPHQGVAGARYSVVILSAEPETAFLVANFD